MTNYQLAGQFANNNNNNKMSKNIKLTIDN